MPGSYRARGIVLRRTKLGEQDLVVTLLGDGAGQVRFVAKGARKPGSRLAGLVNLGNEVDLLLHRGRGLDTASEGLLVVSRDAMAFEYERAAMGEAVLDVACELTVEGEHNPRLPALVSAALDAVCAAATTRLPLVGAAFALKAAAMEGFRPSFDVCVSCGSPVDLGGGLATGFSARDGGVVCDACLRSSEAAAPPADPALLSWCRLLLRSTFDAIAGTGAGGSEAAIGLDALELCRSWLAVYPGVRPRALDYVLDRGLWASGPKARGGAAG